MSPINAVGLANCGHGRFEAAETCQPVGRKTQASLAPPGSSASKHGTDERRAAPPQLVLWKRRLVPLRQKDRTERLAGPNASGGLRSTGFGSYHLAERVAEAGSD